MPKLPRVSGSDATRALEKLGFVQVRQRGSHVVMRRDSEAGAAGCVIRLHAELAMGPLRGILKRLVFRSKSSLPNVSRTGTLHLSVCCDR